MLAESLVRSLIRLVVTVAIIAAIYLLLLKPVLETTESSVNSAFQGGGVPLQQQVNDSLEAAGFNGIDFGDPGSNTVVIDGVDLGSAIDNAPDRRTRRLLRCIDRANGDVARIQRCTRR
jgi:hypothetical protein